MTMRHEFQRKVFSGVKGKRYYPDAITRAIYSRKYLWREHGILVVFK